MHEQQPHSEPSQQLIDIAWEAAQLANNEYSDGHTTNHELAAAMAGVAMQAPESPFSQSAISAQREAEAAKQAVEDVESRAFEESLTMMGWDREPTLKERSLAFMQNYADDVATKKLRSDEEQADLDARSKRLDAALMHAAGPNKTGRIKSATKVAIYKEFLGLTPVDNKAPSAIAERHGVQKDYVTRATNEIARNLDGSQEAMQLLFSPEEPVA